MIRHVTEAMFELAMFWFRLAQRLFQGSMFDKTSETFEIVVRMLSVRAFV